MLHDFQQEQRFRPRCLAGHIQVLGFVAKIFCILHRQCFRHCTHGFLFARVLVVQHLLYQFFRMEKMCPFVFTTCSKVRTNIKLSQQFLVLCEQIIGEETPTRVQMECAKKNFWMQKIARRIGGAIINPGGRTVRHRHRAALD